MTATRTLAAALALGSVLGLSCYSEPQPPSTYRYACDGDGDCTGNEVCVSGRCEQPCHPLSYFAGLLIGVDGQCPFTDGYAGCYNGTCANTCDLDNDLCPSGRRCEDFGIQVSGGGGSLGGSNNTRYGVCVVPCSEDSCPFGQACEDGHCAPDPSLFCLSGDLTGGVELDFCLQVCTDDSACPDDHYCDASFSACAPKCSPECPSGQTCFLGVCGTACDDGGSCADDECCRFDRICAPAGVDLPFPGGECPSTDGSSSDGSTSGSSTSSSSDGSTSGGSTDGSASGGSTGGGSTSNGSTSM